MRILVVNAGSSSLKLALVGDGDDLLAERELSAPGAKVDLGALHEALGGAFGGADVIGHRIVHGGVHFHQPVVIDGPVRESLGELVDLAPLHQPKSLAALDAVTAALPDTPAVACFDTAFHATLPRAAATYAVPAEWRERWQIRRYGFHGLSHAWVARRAPELLESAGGQRLESGGESLRIVSCHLGAGASVCAIADGRSQDTTMGFTPLEGLVMATRSGTVDPGLLLWLLERTGITERQLADSLEHDSGLLALAGTADMRQVIERAVAGDGDATLALGVYVHRLRAAIAAMAAAIGGIDVLVFTGGVGEHAHEVRSAAVAGLRHLGALIDPERNRGAQPDVVISAPESRVTVLVVRAREDLEIAHGVRSLG